MELLLFSDGGSAPSFAGRNDFEAHPACDLVVGAGSNQILNLRCVGGSDDITGGLTPAVAPLALRASIARAENAGQQEISLYAIFHGLISVIRSRLVVQSRRYLRKNGLQIAHLVDL
jgi:hypothetical protein